MNNLKLWASTLALALAALSCVLPGSDGVSNGAPTLIPEPLVNLPDTAGEIAFSSERNGQWQIFVMNADGSGETSLTAPFGDYAYPSWSPDGSRLAMRIDFSDDPADACDSGIAVVDVQQQDGRLTGSVPIALTCEFSDAPTWSPEGSQLVYISSGNSGWDFFRHDLASNSASLLAGIPNWARDPKWSPDGTRLLFSADPQNNGMHEIYVMNLDGSGLLQLTHNSYYDGAPNWSPDGSRIVFSSSPEADSDIYTMNADGSALLRLTTAPGDDFDPDWSPDGTRIAFVTDRHEQNDSNYEIYLVNADGSGEMRLTNNQSIDRWPDWRPGSSAVGQGTCASSASFVADVTIPAGMQFATPVSFTKVWRLENAGGCVWTPDAFRLRFVAGDLMGGPVALYVPGAIQPGASVEVGMALAAPDLPGTYTGTWQLWDASGSPVPDSNGNPLTLTVAIEALPAGQTILPAPVYYFAGEDEARQVWRMGTDGQASQVTFELTGVTSFDISPADGSVAYASNKALLLVDATGAGRRALVTVGADEFLSSPLWSPDGMRLAYSRGGIRIHTPATGDDRLILSNNDSIYAGDFRRFSPLSWSPDGSKLLLLIGYYEWVGLGILSVDDGLLLTEFEAFDSYAWSPDSQHLYLAGTVSYGMGISPTGLYSIEAVPSAAILPLVPDVPAWWPQATEDGRLRYFLGVPGIENPSVSMPVSLYSSLLDGISDRQALRPDLFWLGSMDFRDALWTPDGSHFIARLAHPAAATDEVLYFSVSDGPTLFLMQDGAGFQWGR